MFVGNYSLATQRKLIRDAVPQIDWRHPLTSGLISAVAGGLQIDLASGLSFISNNGGFFGASQNGVGFASDGTSLRRWQSVENADFLSGLTSCSIAYGAQFNSVIAGAAQVARWSGAASYGGFLASSNGANTLGMVIAPGTSNLCGNTVVANPGYHDFVGVWAGGSSMTLYLDGTAPSMTNWFSGGSAAIQTVSEKLFICSHGDANTAMDGSITYCYIYNRALSADEAAEIQNNPAAFLIYPEDDLLARINVGVSTAGSFQPSWAVNASRLIGSGLYVS